MMNIIKACKEYVENCGYKVTEIDYNHICCEPDGADSIINNQITITAVQHSELAHRPDPSAILQGSCPVTNQRYSCTVSSLQVDSPQLALRTSGTIVINEPLCISAAFTCQKN